MAEHPSFRNMPPGEPVTGKTFRADGWQYVDLPSRLTFAFKDEFFAIIGEGNYFILVESFSRQDDWWRGQILISPDGQRRMKAHSEATEKPSVH